MCNGVWSFWWKKIVHLSICMQDDVLFLSFSPTLPTSLSWASHLPAPNIGPQSKPLPLPLATPSPSLTPPGTTERRRTLGKLRHWIRLVATPYILMRPLRRMVVALRSTSLLGPPLPPWLLPPTLIRQQQQVPLLCLLPLCFPHSSKAWQTAAIPFTALSRDFLPGWEARGLWGPGARGVG